MARSNNRSGRSESTFWSHIADALGITSKVVVAAWAKRPSARKHKTTRSRKQAKHKKLHKRKGRSRRSSVRRSSRHRRQKRAVRHTTHRHSAIRRRLPVTGRQPIQSAPSPERSVWHVPYPHIPKILFTRIELPSPHLPSFHRKKRREQFPEDAEALPGIPVARGTAAAAGDAEEKAKSRWSFWGGRKQTSTVISEDTASVSPQEIPSGAQKGDLADLLLEEDASEQPEDMRQKKKNPETKKSESPDESQKKAVVAQSRADAVVAKRKKSQATEMVIQTRLPVGQVPVQSRKKDEAKVKETAEPPTEEQMLQAMEARAQRERKKGVAAFFRSLNYIGMGKHCSAFVQNLAMMLNAGLPLIEALQTIQAELRSRAMRTVVRRITDLVEGGNPLWVSMDEQQVFSPYEVSLVRVGEEAGNLARNMEYLAIQQEKDRNLRQKVKMAMIYPTIVLVLMFIVVMGLGIFVLPNLIQVLYALNVKLPLSTRIVVAFTEFMQKSGMRTGATTIGAFITILILTKYTGFKVVTQWFVFRIPGIGSLAKEASIARFGVILGGLLRSGVPLVDALDSMVGVTTVVSFKRFYQKLRDRVVVGDSFATCFHTIPGSRKVLPVSVQQLIITGEKSGALSDTCLKVAQIYERKAEDTAAKLPVILEPALLLCIGSLVGFIAFSIIVPIYSAVGNVSGG